MKRHLIFKLVLIYIIVISPVFLFFRNSGSEAMPVDKTDNRVVFIKDMTGKTGDFERRLRYIKENFKSGVKRIIDDIKKESLALYGEEFTEELFSQKEEHYILLARQGRTGEVRDDLYMEYEEYVKDNPEETDEITGVSYEQPDTEEGDDTNNTISDNQVPLPDAENKYQFMAIALANYLSFSNDVKGFFRMRTVLLNSITDVKDRVYFASKTCEALLQFYMREVPINKTAIIAAFSSFEKELKNAGYDLESYYSYLSGGYYIGGDIARSLDYGRKGLRYSEELCFKNNIGIEECNIVYDNKYHLIKPEFAAGNIDKAYKLLIDSLAYIKKYYSGHARNDQRIFLYNNIFYVNRYMKEVPPEQELFLGLVYSGYIDEIASQHLTRYINTGKNPEYLAVARKELKKTGGIK